MNIRYPREYNTLNKDQSRAYDLMFEGRLKGENFFLTGNAGTGKSYLANVFAKGCRMNGLHIAKCAPTGIAAVAIEGTTMHSMFKLTNSIAEPETLTDAQRRNVDEHVVNMDVLFIDETSMARVDLLDSVLRQVYAASKTRKANGKPPVQVILCGDFGQLPPVVKQDDRKLFAQLYDYAIGSGYCFRGQGWKFMKFRPIMLREPMRQGNPDFCHALDQIRMGDTAGLDYILANSRKTPDEKAIWICGMNKTVTDRNRACLDALPDQLRTFRAQTCGKVDLDATNLEPYLEYKKGARVMMLVNDTKHYSYCNGSMGTITDIYGRTVYITLDDGMPIEVKPVTVEFKEYAVEDGTLTEKVVGSLTQYPFKLGYAVTIHKSQGQTFDAVNLIPEIFAEGQLYVALSRCRSVETLYIQPVRDGVTIDKRDVRAHQDVKNFMTGVTSGNLLRAAG